MIDDGSHASKTRLYTENTGLQMVMQKVSLCVARYKHRE